VTAGSQDGKRLDRVEFHEWEMPTRSDGVEGGGGIEGGVSELTALTVISEIGPGVSRFATVKKFCSWLGLCPASYRTSPTEQRNVPICLAPSGRTTRDGRRGKNGKNDAFSFLGTATSATTVSPRAGC
jgi:hypothetical protein